MDDKIIPIEIEMNDDGTVTIELGVMRARYSVSFIDAFIATFREARTGHVQSAFREAPKPAVIAVANAAESPDYCLYRHALSDGLILVLRHPDVDWISFQLPRRQAAHLRDHLGRFLSYPSVIAGRA
ncbi:hypothetical protein QLQ15_13350 [Lysobacter sp. LF1]|uniref:Uncharacterized protein n=1 Tax=Lysobacter stagni TaxID=3045172 RepID=A0ABT6XIA8_9GAMM|nr:hypothetical protein [Lysobacter sp. LF1]MDI9239892.1 hypothetical protein [Lysobacter sp. LF1]